MFNPLIIKVSFAIRHLKSGPCCEGKLSCGIYVANQYLCNSDLIQSDIATEVRESFDCEFIRSRNFMISRSFSVNIISISDGINLSLNRYNKN